MRIACPFCGPRENGEFSYLGDAKPKRPAADAGEDAVYDYVYLRDNIAGEMEELWYHGGGCRAWLKVRRNTVTHEIFSVEPAPARVRRRWRRDACARNGLCRPSPLPSPREERGEGVVDVAANDPRREGRRSTRALRLALLSPFLRGEDAGRQVRGSAGVDWHSADTGGRP